MISGFCKERNSEAAFRILDEMVEKGFVRGDCKHVCFLFFYLVKFNKLFF